MNNLDRDHERLWRREDESIPKFIVIRLRVAEGKTCKYGNQTPYALIYTGPLLLAVREPTPLLAILVSRVDTHIEEVKRKLGAMIMQMQSPTDQMLLMINSQQLGPPPPVESGRHALGL